MVTDMNFWEITGMQPTDDLSEVKRIYNEYLEKLKNDRLGLIRLKREYSRECMNIANKNAIKLEAIIKYVDTLYQDIDTRFNDKIWNDLLNNAKSRNDEYFFGQLRNEILGYLLSHDFLSKSGWKIFDKYLDIEKNYENLKKIYPITFLKKIKRELNGNILFECERLEKVNKNPKNADEYIADLFKLGDMIEFGAPFDEIESTIKKLKTYGYYHIFFDVERMNYYVKSQQNDDEILLMCKQFADEKNPYIVVSVANALWYLGEIDKADELWMKVLEEHPNSVKAAIGHARYLIEIEDYYQAKDYIFDIIDTVGEHDEVMPLLKEVNSFIIPNYQEIYDENPDDTYNAIQYAWCLCQNADWDNVIEVLSDVEEDEIISYDLNMLLGRAYFATEQYAQATEYLQKWVKIMMLLPCDGSEEYKEKIERYPAALAILAEDFYEMCDMPKAIYYMEQSIHAYDLKDEERIKSIIRLADFYNQAGEYEKALALSEEAIKIDDYCVWGYIAHQKAAFELNKSADVIRDYFIIECLAPDFKDSYIYAATSYLNNDLDDEASEVVQKAEENEIYDKNLLIIKFIVFANHVKQNELPMVERDFKKMFGDDVKNYNELHSAFYKSLAMRYKSVGDFKKATEYIDKAVSVDSENPYLVWAKAMILREYDSNSALEIYERLKDKLNDSSAFLCDWSNCLQVNDDWERSTEVIKDILLDEDNCCADVCMMNYYMHLFDKSTLTEHYEKARMYIDRFIEKYPEDSSGLSKRLSLAMMTDDVDICDTAIEDAKILIMSNEYLPNEAIKMMALLYIRKGEPEKAIEELEQIITDDENVSPRLSKYSVMARAYQRMNKIDISEEIMRKAYKKTSEPYYAKKIADYNAEMGNFSMAVRWYHKYEELTNENMGIQLSRVHYMAGKQNKAHKIRNDVFCCINKSLADVARDLAWHMFVFCDDIKTAILYMERAMQFSKGDGLIDAYSALALFYRAVNDDKNAVKYAKKLFEIMTQKHDGLLEGYLDVSYGQRDRLDNAALYYIGMNQFDLAEKYLKKMMHGDYLCAWCTEPCCSDAYVRLAQLRMIQGDYDGMADVFHELLKKDSSNQIAQIYLKKAEEMKNENNS